MQVTEHHYLIADWPITVSLPGDMDADRLLPSFRPFRRPAQSAEGVQAGNGRQTDGCTPLNRRRTGSRGKRGAAPPTLLRFSAEEQPDEEAAKALSFSHLVEETDNDLGHSCLFETDCGIAVTLSFAEGPQHLLIADRQAATAYIHREDRHLGQVLTSLLRIAWFVAVQEAGGLSMHAAAVISQGRAYLFTGRSGTGKSTHARLWLSRFPGSTLLNDDNPTVRVRQDGRIMAYGTPWSGKTPCYRPEGFPLGGVVRLRQAKADCFIRAEGVDAFSLLLQGCMTVRGLHWPSDGLASTIGIIAENIPVGSLECLPHEDAAELCLRSLSEIGPKA